MLKCHAASPKSFSLSCFLCTHWSNITAFLGADIINTLVVEPFNVSLGVWQIPSLTSCLQTQVAYAVDCRVALHTTADVTRSRWKGRCLATVTRLWKEFRVVHFYRMYYQGRGKKRLGAWFSRLGLHPTMLEEIMKDWPWCGGTRTAFSNGFVLIF